MSNMREENRFWGAGTRGELVPLPHKEEICREGWGCCGSLLLKGKEGQEVFPSCSRRFFSRTERHSPGRGGDRRLLRHPQDTPNKFQINPAPGSSPRSAAQELSAAPWCFGDNLGLLWGQFRALLGTLQGKQLLSPWNLQLQV